LTVVRFTAWAYADKTKRRVSIEYALIRDTRGREIDGACGQLAALQ
jgi:adenine C2-methylase RlmN of 23S rRNA A2503 and tRNA A37